MPVQEAFWDYFWVAKFFFRAAGILPIGGTPSQWKSALSKFLSIFPLLYMFYMLIPEINYILFWTHTTDQLLDTFTNVIGFVGLQLRSIVVTVNRRKIKRLFGICETLWNQTVLADSKVTSIWTQRARLFSTAYFCALQLVNVLFALTGIAKQLLRPENSTIRYYPFQHPEDSTPHPQYEIKFAIQVIISHASMFAIGSADMTGTLLMLNMCGQLALIRSWLVNISKKDAIAMKSKIKSAEWTLKNCIRRHQIVLESCAELEEAVHHLNLVQIFFGMCSMAIAGARLAEDLSSSQYYVPVVFLICSFFFSCWPAENLSTESSNVAAAIYEVPWYDYSSPDKTTVAIMLMRSQRPVKLTAGKFIELSLETFSSIISTSASYIMVLYRFSSI